MTIGQDRKLAVSENPLTETVAAAAAAAIHAFLATTVLDGSWIDWWARIGPNDEQVVFQTGAGVVAIIASLAALGLATGGAGPRAATMRRLYGKALRRNWRALLLTSAVAPLLAIAAQILSASGAALAPYLFEFALLWTALRLARLAWLVDRLLGVEMDDESQSPQIPKMEVSPDFKRRMGA